MDQERFYEMLDRVPMLRGYWNQEAGELDVEKLDKDLGLMSSGEQRLAQFFVSIWEHNNQRYGFDMVDAVSVLGVEGQKLIVEWVIDPFYP